MTASSGAEARKNGDTVHTYSQGMCQQFVRLPCWEVGSLYGSAIEAWNGAKDKHPGDRTPPEGAPCYYRGGNYGHAVIFQQAGSGNIRSTDCPSSGQVNDTDLGWPERAWGYTYLGWTGDINGVTLPLGDKPPEPPKPPPPGEVDVPQYDHATAGADKNYPAGEWRSVVWENVAGAGAFKANQPTAAIGGRKYTATFHATFDGPQGSSIRMRTVEFEDGAMVEANREAEMSLTSGSTYAAHTHAGTVGKGRNLRFQVYGGKDITLIAADAVILSWE